MEVVATFAALPPVFESRQKRFPDISDFGGEGDDFGVLRIGMILKILFLHVCCYTL